jgi:hypothetical protein
MAHGSPSKLLLAKAILDEENPARLDMPVASDALRSTDTLADATV